MQFIKKHKLLLSLILFTILFFFLFLYIDKGMIMFKVSKENKSLIIFTFLYAWFLFIPTIVLIPIIIIFLISYLKNINGIRKWILFIIGLLFELIFTFFVSLYYMAPGFSFYPTYFDDSILNYENIKKVEVNIDGNIYTSPYYDNDNPNVTIFFPGNSQVSSDVFEYIGYNNLINYNSNLLVMDYPYFGLNYGKLTEDEIYKEIDAYMDYLLNVEGYSLLNIRIAGFSIGTGSACYCAEKYNAKELLLFAPYDRFTTAMNNSVPVFYGPLESCVRFKFENIKRAENIKSKVKIIYSYSDIVIPYDSTKKLINKFNEPELISIDGASHGNVFRNENTALYLLG